MHLEKSQDNQIKVLTHTRFFKLLNGHPKSIITYANFYKNEFVWNVSQNKSRLSKLCDIYELMIKNDKYIPDESDSNKDELTELHNQRPDHQKCMNPNLREQNKTRNNMIMTEYVKEEDKKNHRGSLDLM